MPKVRSKKGNFSKIFHSHSNMGLESPMIFSVWRFFISHPAVVSGYKIEDLIKNVRIPMDQDKRTVDFLRLFVRHRQEIYPDRVTGPEYPEHIRSPGIFKKSNLDLRPERKRKLS
jgi:hypothetical protein